MSHQSLLIWLICFFCDDKLHKLGSFHASLTTTEPGAEICAGKMHCGGSVVVVDSLYIQFCSHSLQLAYLINTCELTIHGDPESFVRGGQILKTFFLFGLMRGGRIQIPILAGHQRLASETPFKWRFAGGPMMA